MQTIRTKEGEPYYFNQDEVGVYETIADELEGNSQDRSLWMRSLELSEGDVNKQKAIYIKLRAEQLKIKSESGNMDAVETAGQLHIDHTTPLIVDSAGSEGSNDHKFGRLITWFLFLSLVAMLIIWQLGYFNWSDVLKVIQQQTAVSQQEPSPATEDKSTAAEEIVEDVIPAIPESKQEPAAESQAASETNDTSKVNAELPAVEPELVQPPVVEEISVPVKPDLTVVFSGDCWVDIRDSTRQFKIFGKMTNGDIRRLGGEPPYRMIFGNYPVVKLLVDGKPYDLSAHADGITAKFTFDPATEVLSPRATTKSIQSSAVNSKSSSNYSSSTSTKSTIDSEKEFNCIMRLMLERAQGKNSKTNEDIDILCDSLF